MSLHLRFSAARWRFGLLLASLSFFMVLVLAIDPTRGDEHLFRLAVIPLLLSAGYAISKRLRFAVGGVVVGLVLSAVNWGVAADDSASTFVAGHMVDALFWSIAMIAVLHAVLTQREVDTDTVLGGVAVYLLAIVIFALLHAIANEVSPGAYLHQGEPILRSDPEFWSVLLYFSIVTMTTLGYGDVVPEGGTSYLLTGAEAILGQLFIAVLIARLVGLRTAANSSHRSSDAEP